MPTLLQRLKIRGPSPATQSAYEALVKSVADGERVVENEIADVLDGRSVEDFQADIQRLEERRAAVADLEQVKQLRKEQAKLATAVAEAKAAFDDHPLQRQMIELQRLGQRREELQEDAMQHASLVTSLRSKAMHLLDKTARRDNRISEISNEIVGLENQRQQFALSEAEVHEYETASNDVAELPKRIAALKRANGSASEVASLTARLLSRKHALKRFAERRAEVERIEKEVAKLGLKMTKAGDERLKPENMEFASRPKPRDL